MRKVSYGRIVYVEPNDTVSTVNGSMSFDNVTWDPEELNMAVDLQVIVPRRSDFGQTELTTGAKGIIEANWNDNDAIGRYISFMQGADIIDKDDKVLGHELTTDYLNATYSEVYRDGKSCKEALGIESIDITFDQHFYPQVNIKFIDVRGYSLMMPTEEQYFMSEKSKVDPSAEREMLANRGYANFFRALFHFPYPRFLLTIKGFYGTPVTFMLAVNEFRNSFNSQTGNFEVNVSFIGYMYGLYTDIPLNLLIAAPYYGSNSDGGGKSDYWNNNYYFDDGNGGDGNNILTFIEFLDNCGKLNDARNEIDRGDSGYKKLERRGQIDDEIAKLKDLEDKLYSFTSRTISLNRRRNSSEILSDTELDAFWFDVKSSDTSEETAKIKLDVKTWNEFVAAWNDYDGDNVLGACRWTPKDLMSEGKWNGHVRGTATEDGRDIIEVDYYKPLFIEKGKTESGDNIYTLAKTSEGGITAEMLKKDDDGYPELYKKLLNSKYATKKVYYIMGSEIQRKINVRESELNTEKSSTVVESKDEMNRLYDNNLGFNPFILNVYRMIFAHMDCFMHEFYDLLNTIRNLGEIRQLGNFGVSRDDMDMSGRMMADAIVPPFPAIFIETDNGRREQIYPGKIDGMEKKMPEIKFIEEMINGVLGLKDRANEIILNQQESRTFNEENDNAASNKKYKYNQTAITDYRHKSNPYTAVRPNNVNELLYFFTYRALSSKFQIFKSYGTDNLGIGTVEASNFDRLHSNITNELKKQIVSLHDLINSEEYKYIDNFEKYCEDEKDSLPFKVTFDKGSGTISVEKNEIPVYCDGFPKKNSDYERPYGDDSHLSLDSENIFEIMSWADAHDSVVDVINSINSSEYESMKSVLTGRVSDKNQPYRSDLTKSEELYDILRASQFNFGSWFFKNNTNMKGSAFISDTYKSYSKEDQAGMFLMLLSCDVFHGNGTEVVIKIPSLELSGVYHTHYLTLCLWGYVLSKGISSNIISHEAHGEMKFLNWSTYEYVYGNENLKNKIIEFFKNFVNSERWKKIYNGITSKTNYHEATLDTQKVMAMNDSLKKIIYDSIIDEENDQYVYIVNNETNDDKSLTLPISEYKEFIIELFRKYGEEKTMSEEYKSDFKKSDVTDAYRLSLYNSLKNLYDKWANSYTSENFELRSPQDDVQVKRNRFQYGASYDSGSIDGIKEFDNFMFVDCYYNDISYRFKMNPMSVMDIITRQIQAESNYSIYEFMAEIMQKNKMLLQALPVYNNFYSYNTIENIFMPRHYDTMKSGMGSTYVGMYTYEVSHVVEDDRFDDHLGSDYLMLTDMNGITEDPTPNAVGSKLFGYNGRGLSINVPAFGVTYARQNQSYFKNIDVNMDNPRITDYSIANLFALTNLKNGNSLNQPMTVGNDIYSIYANRSYNCSVDMMGCANIMPMMYFQLNNIPMFRGAYMISNVEHHIKAGDFTTKFTGVRISKNQIPYNDNIFNYDSTLDYRTGENYGLTEPVVTNGNYTVDCANFYFPNVESAMKHKMCNRNGSKCANSGPYNTTQSGHWCATAVAKFIAVGKGKTGKDIDSVRIGNGVQSSGLIADSTGVRATNGQKVSEKGVQKYGYELIHTFPPNTTRAERQKWTAENAIPGDIACMYENNYHYLAVKSNKNGKPVYSYGHVCMYSGDKWVSDFAQVDMYVYNSSDPQRKNQQEIYVFRHKGCSRREITSDPNANVKGQVYNLQGRTSPKYPYRIFNISRQACGVSDPRTKIIPYDQLTTEYLNSVNANVKKACKRFTTHKDTISACVLFILYIKCHYIDKNKAKIWQICKEYTGEDGWRQYAADVALYIARKLKDDKITTETTITYTRSMITALGEIIAMKEQNVGVGSEIAVAWTMLNS